MEFEWDIEKAAGNLRKHGVSFEVAQTVFQDDFAMEQHDSVSEAGEVRWNVMASLSAENSSSPTPCATAKYD